MKRVLVYGMTDNPGGMEAYVINLVKRVKDDVTFDYVIDFATIAHSEFIESMGSKVYHIPPKGKQLFAHWAGLWKILKQHPEYETVYFNVLDAGVAITELVPWLLGRKVVTHSHNSSTDKMRLHRLCRPLMNFLTHGYVACSKIASEFMFGDGEKALVIPNAIEAEKFVFNPQLREQKRAELGLKDEFVVCHIGRLVMQKNPLRLLDIFKAFLAKEPNAVLLSIGTGDMESEVHRHAEELGIGERVRFLGTRLDIPELLQAADMFLFPSLFEGLGIVVLEAQASGLPCVVSTEVPREVNVTGNVSFVSLDESDDVWAENILAVSADFVRENTWPKLIAGGYDIHNCQEKDRELLAMLTQA